MWMQESVYWPDKEGDLLFTAVFQYDLSDFLVSLIRATERHRSIALPGKRSHAQLHLYPCLVSLEKAADTDGKIYQTYRHTSICAYDRSWRQSLVADVH